MPHALPKLHQQLRELIALPSVSSTSARWDMSNRAVVELLATWLADLGFKTELIPVSEDGGKMNLIATRGTGPGGLVLAGHTDTVPYDEFQWQQDPFLLTERDQRLYGLGATDMKGFFPIALAAIAQFSDAPLQQPIIVLATADEESSMSGARHLAQLGKPKARYAVIGEPTGLKPIRMHKGILMEAIRVEGLAGHSSNPELGKSALEGMHEVMAELLALRRDLQQRFHNPGFAVPVPTLNLGHIHGGDNPNRICGRCELHMDLRPLPGSTLAELRAEIDARLATVTARTGLIIERRELIGGVEPFEQAADSALVRALEAVSGVEAGSVAFATEAAFLQDLGMETMIFGPGSIDQAHQPNEFLPLDQIEPGIRALSQLIQRLCVEPTPAVAAR